MPLASLNYDPRSINYIGPFLRTEMLDKFSMVDIGARGGFHSLWMPIAPYGSFIGFEPDRKECERLNALYQAQENKSHFRLYPIAIGGTAGTQTLHISNNTPDCDSLLQLNENYWKRYPNLIEVETVGETTVNTETLEGFVTKNDVSHIDFLKIDVEGAELQILKASKNVLKDKNVLGIFTEYMWEPNVKNGQAGFSELDSFLRDEGFFLFDLETWRFPRTPLPVGHIVSSQREDGSIVIAEPDRYKTYGQLAGGNALYFRDPIKSGYERTNQLAWNEGMILKFVAILDMYNYQDFAIEVVDHFRNKFESADPDMLIDTLTPRLGNAIVPYDTYFEISSELYKQGLSPHLRSLVKIPKPQYSPAASRRKKFSQG